jgi:hypothetical protein
MARKGRNAPRKGKMKMMEKEGAVSSMRPKARPSSKLAPRASMRPRARPDGTTMEASLRPRARPDDMPTVDEIGAIERGNRAAKRTAEDLAMFALPGPASAGAVAGKKAMGMKHGGKVKKMKYGGKVKKMKKGGKMPDLTGDGKVTQADVLKGRGVFKKGGKVRGYGLARGGKACKMR